jgi:hypothetical protein
MTISRIAHWDNGWIQMSGYLNHPNTYLVKTTIWISVIVFVFYEKVKWKYSYSISHIFSIRFHIYWTKMRTQRYSGWHI